MREIHLKQDAKIGLINGINKLADIVGVTFGPKGKTVIIPDKNNYPKYTTTKDGDSVAESVELADPIEEIGSQIAKQTARQTMTMAGDGTTTSTLLLKELINNLKDLDYKSYENKINQTIKTIVDNLKASASLLRKEDIYNVAFVSSNSDEKMSKVIYDAYDFSKIVKVEESNFLEDVLVCHDGMFLNTPYFSKDFVTNQSKGFCELENPKVLVIDGKLEDFTPFQTIIKYLASKKEPLLIITEHVTESLMRAIRLNLANDTLKIGIMKSPGFSTHRKNLLKDICKFTGATLVDNLGKLYSLEVLGKLKSCKMTNKNSILVKDEQIVLDEVIQEMEELLNEEMTSYEKELLQQRIENLKGKVSIIKVGGTSEPDVRERKDRYDDAVLAVASALEEGIVIGGGIALKNAVSFLEDSEDLFKKQLYKSLIKPSQLIEETGVIITDQIVDPLKVVRCSLENSIASTKIILNTDGVVLRKESWII